MTKLVFLIDVDNTLLNNDAVKEEIDRHLRADLGPDLTERFWEIYEQVRKDQGVVDIPQTLINFRTQSSHDELEAANYLHILSVIDQFPFQDALYPQALTTLQYLGTLGETVIVSDGDQFFQAKKIITSHLAAAVDSRVLLYMHKQDNLAEIQQQYPGDHYVIIDDKPQILIDIKEKLGDHSTTVFVKQGKYAAKVPENFAPDLTVEQLADLQQYSTGQFLACCRRNDR